MNEARVRRVVLAMAGVALALAAGPAWAQDGTPTPAPPVTIQATATVETTATEVVFAGPTATPGLVLGLIGGETWAPPVNVSQSGAASAPVLAADDNGGLHLLWWDSFAGTFYAEYTAETGWSAPVPVPEIVGGRSLTVNTPPSAPGELLLLADNARNLHAFYRDSRGNLLYSFSRFGTLTWGAPQQLAATPLDWAATVDAAGVLHVTYVRTLNTTQFPAGIYYVQSVPGGGQWQNLQILTSSLYFRALTPEEGHLAVAAGGTEQVVVTWDDPRSRQSVTMQSADSGRTFEPPTVVSTEADTEDELPRGAFLAPLPNGEWLRLWRLTTSCALYQQVGDATLSAWTAPERALENLDGCLSAPQTYALPDGRLALLGKVQPAGNLVLALWDGVRWSEPVLPRISFVDPFSNRSTELSCTSAVLIGQRASVAGCDGQGDVWVTSGLVEVDALLPAVSTEWTPPEVLSGPDSSAGLAAPAMDAEGRLHVLWSSSLPGDIQNSALSYLRREEGSWTSAGVVLRSPGGGQASHPALVADAGGHVHAVWSGGAAGQVYYSNAFARDADAARGWQNPLSLSEATGGGSWPSLAIDPNGRLYAAYATPLNEGRGVYFRSSGDQGESWSPAVRVFDAVAAGWPMVGKTVLQRDSAGRLHLVWVRLTLPPESAAQGVYYAWSDDGGQTWNGPRTMVEDDAGYPILAVDNPDDLHLLWVSGLSGTPVVWHVRSPDGGETWSEANAVSGLRIVAPNVSVAADGEGGLHLVGVERSGTESTALVRLRWDGSGWGEREATPLGFNQDNASGVVAQLLPDGELAAFYRVFALAGGGNRQYVLGYTSRPVPPITVAAAPTFTPAPAPTLAVTLTPGPTVTPAPTVDLNVAPNPGLGQEDWMRVGAILAGMVLVAIVAIVGLRRRG